MDNATLRAWWSHRQGLDGSLERKPLGDILRKSGWARSVGGVGPYLTLFARGGVGREAVDADVAKLAIHELPSARGCTYVLPAADYALALKVGESFAEAPMKVARKLGVTDKEIEDLSSAVIEALARGPLSPEQIRDATGDASRSLGDEGKKKGIGTTLPLSLGILQARGDIRRVSTNGRLDNQRYHYALWRPGPMKGAKLSLEDAYTELARRFFGWAGPATLAEFQAFSGLGVKASKLAVEPLELEPPGAGDARLMLPDERKELISFARPAKPSYRLVSSLDGMLLLRRDLLSLLDERDREGRAFDEKGGSPALGSLTDLPNHAILDRGRLVGLWEFDPDEGRIVWTAFVRPDAALEQAVAETERYVREDLGDARSFSLDSPKSRAPRLRALRAAAAPAVTHRSLPHSTICRIHTSRESRSRATDRDSCAMRPAPRITTGIPGPGMTSRTMPAKNSPAPTTSQTTRAIRDSRAASRRRWCS
jgi:hypothetical protein